jgi:hypothetical protein
MLNLRLISAATISRVHNANSTEGLDRQSVCSVESAAGHSRPLEGTLAHRFKRRVIQLSGIVLSHALQ